MHEPLRSMRSSAIKGLDLFVVQQLFVGKSRQRNYAFFEDTAEGHPLYRFIGNAPLFALGTGSSGIPAKRSSCSAGRPDWCGIGAANGGRTTSCPGTRRRAIHPR